MREREGGVEEEEERLPVPSFFFPPYPFNMLGRKKNLNQFFLRVVSKITVYWISFRFVFSLSPSFLLGLFLCRSIAAQNG